MRVNGIQCDTCCKLHNENSEAYFPDVPKEWFAIVEGKKFQVDGNHIVMHFCSIQCLAQWVEKNATPYTEKPTRFTELTDDDNPARGWRDL